MKIANVDFTGIAILVGGALVLYYGTKGVRAAANAVGDGIEAIKETATATVPYINPADSRNVVNSAVNSVGAAVSGDKDFSLGGWIYDVTHDPIQLTTPFKPPEKDNTTFWNFFP